MIAGTKEEQKHKVFKQGYEHTNQWDPESQLIYKDNLCSTMRFLLHSGKLGHVSLDENFRFFLLLLLLLLLHILFVYCFFFVFVFVFVFLKIRKFSSPTGNTVVHPLIKDFSIYCRINDGAIYCRKKISGSLYREILKDGYSFFVFVFASFLSFFFFFLVFFNFFLFFLCLKNLPENHQRGRKRKYYHSSRALVLEKNTFKKNLIFPFSASNTRPSKFYRDYIDDHVLVYHFCSDKCSIKSVCEKHQKKLLLPHLSFCDFTL